MPAAQNAPSNKVPEIRTGDTVVILHGKDAGKRGKVERVLRNPQSRRKTKAGWRQATSREAAVLIAGLNIAKRHSRPRQKASSTSSVPQIQQGGIIDKPMPIDMSNVMIVCPRCERVTRVKHETLANGRRVRVCRHCNEQLEAQS